MVTTEVLQEDEPDIIADLNDTDRTVLEQTLQGKKAKNIAEDLGCTGANVSRIRGNLVDLKLLEPGDKQGEYSTGEVLPGGYQHQNSLDSDRDRTGSDRDSREAADDWSSYYKDLRAPEAKTLYATLTGESVGPIANHIGVTHPAISGYRSNLVDKGYMRNLKPGRGPSEYIPGIKLISEWDSYEPEPEIFSHTDPADPFPATDEEGTRWLIGEELYSLVSGSGDTLSAGEEDSYHEKDTDEQDLTEEPSLDRKNTEDSQGTDKKIIELGRDILGEGYEETLEQEEDSSSRIDSTTDVKKTRETVEDKTYEDNEETEHASSSIKLSPDNTAYDELMDVFDALSEGIRTAEDNYSGKEQDEGPVEATEHEDSEGLVRVQEELTEETEETDEYPEESYNGVDEELEELLSEEEEDGIHKDDLFELLGNSRRRAVLRYVDEFEDEAPFSLGEISEEIAAYENGMSLSEISSDERKRVYVALYQTHLSKLDEASLVEYNQSRGLIEVGKKFDIATPHLEDEFYTEDQRVYIEDEEGYLSRFLQRIPFYGEP